MIILFVLKRFFHFSFYYYFSAETNQEGLFLVRESPQLDGAFILSVFQNNQPRHYQINRHGEDAFFSIGLLTFAFHTDHIIKSNKLCSLEDGHIVHGLDTLIALCQKEGTSIFGPLDRPCKKDLPPLNTRRHGRCNLLHRATKEGNFKLHYIF